MKFNSILVFLFPSPSEKSDSSCDAQDFNNSSVVPLQLSSTLCNFTRIKEKTISLCLSLRKKRSWTYYNYNILFPAFSPSLDPIIIVVSLTIIIMSCHQQTFPFISASTLIFRNNEKNAVYSYILLFHPLCILHNSQLHPSHFQDPWQQILDECSVWFLTLRRHPKTYEIFKHYIKILIST